MIWYVVSVTLTYRSDKLCLLKIQEVDAIGGSGSRGYGRIEFEFNDKAMDGQFKALNPFSEKQIKHETGRNNTILDGFI